MLSLDINRRFRFLWVKNTDVLDPREFEEKFLQLVQVYEFVDDPAPKDIEPSSLHEKLQSQWRIFKENLKVVRLRQTEDLSPFVLEDKLKLCYYRIFETCEIG